MARAHVDMWTDQKQRADAAEARIAILEKALSETLAMAEMFVPIDLQAPGFRRARAALNP